MSKLDDIMARHFPAESEPAPEPTPEPVTPDEPAGTPDSSKQSDTISDVDGGVAADIEEPKKEEEASSRETSSDFLKRLEDEKAKQGEDSKLKSRIRDLEPMEEAKNAYADGEVLKALELAGFDIDLVKESLSDGTKEVEEKEETGDDRIGKLEKQIADKQVEENMNALRSGIKSTIEGKEEFELINTFGQEEEVLQVMIQAFQKHNRELEYEEAAKLVEAELEDQFFSAYDKLKISKKYKSKYEVKKELNDEVNKEDAERSEKIENITNASAGNVLPPTSKKFIDKNDFYADMAKRHNL